MPVKLVSWSEIVDWTFNLSKKIEDSGYRPDIVVAVARGGYVPARLICDFMGISDLLSVQSQHWVEAAKVTQKAILRHPFKIDAENKNILIVDDIVDTGETLKLAKEFVLENWKPNDARTASLQWISPVAKYKPDYYLIEVKDWAWFQYPWTRLEDVMEFIERIFKEDERTKQGISDEEFKKVFSEWYGISQEDLGNYWQLAFEKLLNKKIIVKNGSKYYYKS